MRALRYHFSITILQIFAKAFHIYQVISWLFKFNGISIGRPVAPQKKPPMHTAYNTASRSLKMFQFYALV